MQILFISVTLFHITMAQIHIGEVEAHCSIETEQEDCTEEAECIASMCSCRNGKTTYPSCNPAPGGKRCSEKCPHHQYCDAKINECMCSNGGSTSSGCCTRKCRKYQSCMDGKCQCKYGKDSTSGRCRRQNKKPGGSCKEECTEDQYCTKKGGAYKCACGETGTLGQCGQVTTTVAPSPQPAMPPGEMPSDAMPSIPPIQLPAVPVVRKTSGPYGSGATHIASGVNERWSDLILVAGLTIPPTGGIVSGHHRLPTGIEVSTNTKWMREHQTYVDGVRVQYGDVWGPWHGNTQGGQVHSCQWMPGDAVVEVRGWQSKIVARITKAHVLKFRTRNGVVCGGYGDLQGNNEWIASEPGCVLEYLAGYNDNHFMRQFEFHWIC